MVVKTGLASPPAVVTTVVNMAEDGDPTEEPGDQSPVPPSAMPRGWSHAVVGGGES